MVNPTQLSICRKCEDWRITLHRTQTARITRHDAGAARELTELLHVIAGKPAGFAIRVSAFPPAAVYRLCDYQNLVLC